MRIYPPESYSVDSKKGNAKIDVHVSDERTYIDSNGND